MKRVIILSIFLIFLASCVPAPLDLPPPGTVAALTMAAMPKTDTPVPTHTPAPTDTVMVVETPTLEFNLSAPGAACVPPNTPRQRGIVTRILDGETIEVAVNNIPYQVRYIGLDAPGIAPTLEWQGPQAIGANERLVGGKSVVLVMDQTDTNQGGIRLRYVLADSVFINYELVRQGYAQAFSSPPNVACDSAFRIAEAGAKAALVGLWSATPIPPATVTPTPSITPTITETSQPPCNCFKQLSCNSFGSQGQAQACMNYCESNGAPFVVDLLDKNHNGKACEGLDK